MTKCEDNYFPCQNPDYDDFDRIARKELSQPISADELLNHSYFCMPIPVTDQFTVGDLDHKLYLKTLRGEFGLYHLWTEYENCDDHDTHTMLCAYVGKGPPDIRIGNHIKNKWKTSEQLYITFTPMSNRLSKYYEQLFLDRYDFDLNFSENSGSKKLYAVWDDERYTVGTHLNEVSSLSTVQSPADW